jgi:hypothetical protein
MPLPVDERQKRDESEAEQDNEECAFSVGNRGEPIQRHHHSESGEKRQEVDEIRSDAGTMMDENPSSSA